MNYFQQAAHTNVGHTKWSSCLCKRSDVPEVLFGVIATLYSTCNLVFGSKKDVKQSDLVKTPPNLRLFLLRLSTLDRLEHLFYLTVIICPLTTSISIVSLPLIPFPLPFELFRFFSFESILLWLIIRLDKLKVLNNFRYLPSDILWNISIWTGV